MAAIRPASLDRWVKELSPKPGEPETLLMGVPLSELSREELLAVINFQGKEIERLRNGRQ